MVTRVPGGPKPKCRATYCQKCWGTKMCRRRASSGPVTASTTPIQARLARVKRHQCQRRCSRITACPTSQATMDSGREPDQQQHDQQQAVGGRLAGGPGDRLAGGGLPAGPATGSGRVGTVTRHLQERR